MEKQEIRNKLKNVKIDYAPFILVYSMMMVYIFFCLYTNRSMFGASPYSTYTLQALAWRNGQISLGQDYPWLELAVFQGDWYVSFPPVPSIPMYLLTFLFGAETPDNLMVKLYVLLGCIAIYYLLRKAGYETRSAMGLAFLCSYASCLTELTIDGGVWHQAQTLGFCLMALSLLLIWNGDRKSVTASLLCYALAVGCRPFHAVYGILLLAIYLEQIKKEEADLKTAFYRALPGLILGLLVAVCYGCYNYARFGNIFEFGHNHLPEFSTQGGKQFALDHIGKNIKTFLFGAPFSKKDGVLELKQFGFSMFLANPVFLLMPGWIIRDIIKKSFSVTKGVLLGCFVVQLFLLLMHRTFGGFQFGARYTCDLLLYAAAYLALSGHQRRMHLGELLVMIAAFCFAIYGTAVLLG